MLLLALNATDGKVIWQTIPAGDPNKNYITQGLYGRTLHL